ncbi:MAG: hypothetical protein HYV40_00865 [Candidatus Levybacteria bacterium]|nr:hypothetical protein [Candidatus Levybacteria bacterium]
MAVNKRLLFWLLKAYVKKWGKAIVLSFIAGLVIFFTLLSTSRFLLSLLPIEKRSSIGYIGAYSVDTLPHDIHQKLSRGLTKVENDGSIKPDAARSWEIKNGGKTYVFTLRNDVFYSDGRKLTAKTLPYEFRGVKKEVIDDDTVSFTLHDQYTPFLVTVTRPIMRKGFVGLGEFSIQNIELNGEFVKSLTIVSNRDKLLVERYSFYPSEDALKIAFALGEIKKALGLSTATFLNTEFVHYKNTSIQKTIDRTILVTLFFDTRDPVLSDPKIRSGLSYALPESFATGERAFLPYAPSSKFANNDGIEKHQDFSHAHLLLDAAKEQTNGSGVIKITLKTLPKYRKTALAIQEVWKSVGVETVIEEVDGKPNRQAPGRRKKNTR